MYKRMVKIKDKCYEDGEVKDCKYCKTYDWDPTEPDRVYPVLLPKNSLSSVRVLKDGFQGNEENSG